MKFMIRFFSQKQRKTVRHIIDTQTVGEALKRATALTIGEGVNDLVIIQEDEK